jgi:hypothetical protein
MVDITNRLGDIEKRVAKWEYITINRGRQYGKTTTLYHLAQRLSKDYVVFSISFEQMGKTEFATEESLTYYFLDRLRLKLRTISNLNDYVKDTITSTVAKYSEKKEIDFSLLNELIPDLCEKSEKPIVLIIDEVDSASNYESFIKLLRLLRDKYLNRMDEPTFQSVILAGVYDIKNLKLKVRPETDHQYNSPWNIAVAYDGDMSFSAADIQKMLAEYENDHHTGMNLSAIAQMIYDYTSGYPFFVSRVCQLIDNDKFGWNKEGVLDAVKLLLKEQNTFFDDLSKKLDTFPDMKKMLKEILFSGYAPSFNIYYKHISIAAMFNYIGDCNGKVKISNRIIETWLYNLFSTEEEIDSHLYDKGSIEKSQFIDGKTLKMDKILEKFAQHFRDIYGNKDLNFKEEEGRKYFMLYVRPIINGTGNYYIEAQTRDLTRTDMIIDYYGTQYIIEMKIWRGDSYNERGENQLFEYLDFYHTDKGYMLSFCFNKKSKPEAKTISLDGREIVEVVV